ncbi:HvfX family Cu-binding RiPP maturation protein [Pasteurella canis]|uniref:Putative transmembrane protein n=1 Tax=Pasteurella canis TaxID=753 RepID=A0A379ESP4_9PAST|nr:DoxX family protein [Pasteurella canis]MXN88629.1 DoxX family membrane protein [Pasteurella canis]UAX42511.1 DoxX family protein [Pasteurella canis]UDW84089.1 DoxX family protein [Pasteurella canis]UEC23535.1 DoxX family protein [Pasteurella canis]SUC09209.1 putative transmembrane protein [Pasteurella canis]
MDKQRCYFQDISTGIGLLGLRLFLAWEFFESGMEKLNGENWFMEVQDSFPFPFNLLPADLSWLLAMGAELLLPVLLILGLSTRFSALSLAILTVVAWYTVHADAGYNVCNNGYKMALIYLVALLPLLTQGAGMLSLDSLLQRKFSAIKWLKFI